MSIRSKAARLLLAAARFLVGEHPTPREEEDEDGPLPLGHPVVVRSEEALRMVREGAERKDFGRRVKVPVVPLKGSLAERRARAGSR